MSDKYKWPGCNNEYSNGLWVGIHNWCSDCQPPRLHASVQALSDGARKPGVAKVGSKSLEEHRSVATKPLAADGCAVVVVASLRDDVVCGAT